MLRFPVLLLLVAAGACAEEVTLATSDGWQLPATVWAPAGKSPTHRGVILLHMEGHSRADWKSVGDRLAKDGHAVISLDFRGHGKSKKGATAPKVKDFADADFAAMVEDLRAAADLLTSRKDLAVETVCLVGAELGADVAIAYAAGEPKAPLGPMVLISPSLNHHGLDAEEAIGKVEAKVLFSACKEDHPGFDETTKLFESKHGRREFERYATGARGTDILRKFPELADAIRQWVKEP